MVRDAELHAYAEDRRTRVIRWLIAWGCIAGAAMLALMAGQSWGQDVALHPATAPVLTDPAGPQLNQLLESINHGNGWAIAGVVVSLLTLAIRKGVLNKLPWPKAVALLHDHPAIAMATPFVLSAIGGVVTTFASGTPFSWATLSMSVLKVGVTAIGAFTAARTIAESQAIGQAAAVAAVPDKAAAADGLSK